MNYEEKNNSKSDNRISTLIQKNKKQEKREEQKIDISDKLKSNLHNSLNQNLLPPQIDSNQLNEIHFEDKKNSKNKLIQQKQYKNKPIILAEKENQIDSEINKKEPDSISKKKDWSTWSTQEKILFYELIANGDNYSSLQKLFKTMNYV